LVAKAEALDPATLKLTELELGAKSKAVQQAVHAAGQLPKLKALEFAGGGSSARQTTAPRP